jgi:hypothetical protein
MNSCTIINLVYNYQRSWVINAAEWSTQLGDLTAFSTGLNEDGFSTELNEDGFFN